MNTRKSEVTQLKMQLAAYIFVYTSKDGMVISQLLNVAPIKLYQWSKSNAWKKALRYWGYNGEPFLQGDEFYQRIKAPLVKRSLEKAEKLWMQLFGLTKHKTQLQQFLEGEHDGIDL